MLNFKEYSKELDDIAESVILTEEELTQLDEVLNTSARLKKRQFFIRTKARRMMQRKLQSKRLATPTRLKGRAKNRAKALLIRRLFQGRTRSQIPISQRQQVDKKLAMMKGAIARISTKLLRRVKQDDIASKTKFKSKDHPSAGAL